jgi:hypothetical protein
MAKQRPTRHLPASARGHMLAIGRAAMHKDATRRAAAPDRFLPLIGPRT